MGPVAGVASSPWQCSPCGEAREKHGAFCWGPSGPAAGLETPEQDGAYLPGGCGRRHGRCVLCGRAALPALLPGERSCCAVALL